MRVVICGAGIAGLALGNQLSERDWDVTIVDRAPAPRTAGYMVDFFGLGYDAAERMGLLPRLTELGYDVPGANFVDDAGRVRARLSYERFARAVDGKLLSIMRPDLELALRGTTPRRGRHALRHHGVRHRRTRERRPDRTIGRHRDRGRPAGGRGRHPLRRARPDVRR